MRHSDYILLMQLNETISENLKTNDNAFEKSLVDEYINSLKLIRQVLVENTASLKEVNLLENIESLIKTLSDENIDIKDFTLLFDRFSDACAKNIDYKINVLFVAELGGKWDSMASVYHAMKNRDDVIADVVIQPIFRKVTLSDGSERFDLVYEDYLTPMGIQHIPYEKYDFKKARPDITFISQPYEGVTIPMFWPENISKYSRLVYLPYFAAVTLNEMSSAFNSFFKLKTQKYSWRIACQSVVMKQKYEMYASKKGKNVVATGIPKWDYPMTLNRENTPMPKNWRKKLEGRKVFLWNTHFSVDVCGSQLLTPKALEFLRYFTENKDIALIWRRHPMLESVIKVYHSDKRWQHYLELKKLVQDSDNMVIDDCASYAPSFVWSDALISDFSTLMDQYIFMNKPILMLVNGDIASARTALCSENELCDYGKLAFANTLEMQVEFVQNVCADKQDIYLEQQKDIREKYFALADGKCGERISKIVIKDFKREAGLPHRSTDIIICGSVEDSRPCIEQLDSINVDYFFCDLFLPEIMKSQYAVLAMDEIKDFSYDCIVVTDCNNFDFIKRILVAEYGVPEEKIMNFQRYYDISVPKMICDRIMFNPTYSQYSGIILGISHSEVGILSDHFKKPFCNLSVSSQDLYYQYNTLLYCLKKHLDKLKNLEYAIIDLYDYNYFNFDTSLSKEAVNYWWYGGMQLLPHNFNNNSLFKESYDDIMKTLGRHYYGGMQQPLVDVWNKYFGEVHRFVGFKGFSGNFPASGRMNMVTDSEIENYEYERKIVTQVHEKTIQENKQIFIKLIKLLRTINPNIKIYTIVIPKYIETEKNDEKHLSKFEAGFNEIIHEVSEKYPFTHLDLKKLTNISQVRDFYFDAAHLNYYGAYILTKMLNDLIFGEEP